jgi:predicted nucleic acid-binding protein
MFKRRRITHKQATAALTAYGQIPLRFLDVTFVAALKLSDALNIYAYDAYVLCCALNNNCPMISLDAVLVAAAREVGVEVIEVIT